uniref:DNA ligase n=1 Tax=Plutella xylostella granulovirus TaxID=98383 RepID=A0A1B2CSK9_9BBAC|nr:PlxyGVORF101 protein [Plutella xylostella granulovirus]
MLFSQFVEIYNHLTNLTCISEITNYVNAVHSLSGMSVNELHLWLYRFLTFEQKCRINDKHLLTIFCKIDKVYVDRQNLMEMFKKHGVEQACSMIPRYGNSCTLTLQEAYNFLKTLKSLPTKSILLIGQFKKIVHRCDASSMKCLISLIRSNNKGKRGVCKKRNLYLFKQVFANNSIKSPGHPIEPMLAQPCKSLSKINFEIMCIETKHDGERLQIHKHNDTITFYKRNLNQNFKCHQLVSYVEAATVNFNDLIIDCELLPDNKIVVFDIIYANEKCFINSSLEYRKNVLHELFIDNQVIFKIDYKLFNDKSEAIAHIYNRFVLETDLEGVIIKNYKGVYEPKRKKWYKIKKAYFTNVCSADLVVVGGWKTNKKITIYLVACPVIVDEKWYFLPVSKVKYAKQNLENQLEPYTKQPWLITNGYLKNKTPNMVARDPFKMPVWEIEGDFIRTVEQKWKCGHFISNYVSIRLPRYIKLRKDKNYKCATKLFELKLLCAIAKDKNLLSDSVIMNYFLQSNVKVNMIN